MYEVQTRKPGGTCLLIDNHPIFGGFAKSNEFDVDGYRVKGPQGSVDFTLPGPLRDGPADEYWRALGLPDHLEFARLHGGNPAITFPKSTVAGMYWSEPRASIGYFFQNSLTGGKGVWVKDIWQDDLQRAPWPEPYKQALLTFRNSKKQYKPDNKEAAWLDTISYADFITKVMGLSPDVLSYITPITDVIGSPQVSAYAARRDLLPGASHFPGRSPYAEIADRDMSFPGGNATILRHFVKAVIPDAIQGPRTFEAIANNPVDLSALDRPGAQNRMRLSATAVRVSHEGDPKSADLVSVVYEKGGQLYRVRAKGAALCIGSWVAKHIVTDLPSDYQAAFDQFFYGPTLIVNVALRNWRFLDKLGFASARWFDGFGFYSTIRHPMVVGNRAAPFDPDKPIVMTFYVPQHRTDLPLPAQGSAGRATMFGTSYATYEQQIVAHMQRIFSPGGFNARRDIAGIVLNRWGHARMSPAPGFYFGKPGMPSPLAVLRQPFGRIAFGNSELSGAQNWPGAVAEGKRAITQVMEAI
jgi:spermidine dehydrogenase